MKKLFSIICILAVSVFVLTACSDKTKTDSDAKSDVNTESTEKDNKGPDPVKEDAAGNINDSATDAADNSSDSSAVSEDNSAVAISENQPAPKIVSDTSDGFKEEASRIVISKAGEYTFSGYFGQKQIYVDAQDAEVELVLAGCTLENSSDSAIYVENADKVTVKVPDQCISGIFDYRPKKVDDNDETGSAAVFSKADLKLSGKGSLNIVADYNNGIHSKKDIKIKNITLEVTAPNNAIKGNDSITIESGNLKLTSTEGDGLKTKSTDVSAKGRQKGIISIESGTIDIYAADECISASYDVVINEGPDTKINQYVYQK